MKVATNKAPGLDDISNRILHMICDRLLLVLEEILALAFATTCASIASRNQ